MLEGERFVSSGEDREELEQGLVNRSLVGETNRKQGENRQRDSVKA